MFSGGFTADEAAISASQVFVGEFSEGKN